jgi:sulfatase maturation enzyme AslB (radical SAM superfamily)
MVSTQDCEIDITANICKGFDLVHLCGNHGDPIYHPRFHDLIQRIRADNPNIIFSMHTNGAFRNSDWWKVTANLFTKSDSITFSIDGLPTNNHTYRVNSRWNSIHDAVTTLREQNAEIEMIWKWIVFKYNENDIEQGIQLARDLNFDNFLVVRSYRRDADDPFTSTIGIEQLKEKLLAKSLS